MRGIRRWLWVAGLLFVGLQGLPVGAAENLPTIHQVYQAADSGRLDDAQLMMERVLRAHPDSAKAHYVEAELLARMDRPSLAEKELKTAERLEPGLAFAKSQSVVELRQQIARESSLIAAGLSKAPAKAGGFSWGILLLGLGVLAVVVLLVRALFMRNQATYYPAAENGGYAGYPVNNSVMSPGGSGLGSGIVGGLATGAAVGAGMVAGEMLAHKLLDGSTPAGQVDTSGGFGSSFGNDDATDDATGYDMGGGDFGLTDSSSWDDAGNAGSDDWS